MNINRFYKKNVNTAIIMLAIIAGVFVCCQHKLLEIDDISELSDLKTNSLSLQLNEFEYFGKIYQCKEGEFIWQKQLSLIREENDRTNSVKDNGLVLEGYRYLGMISSLKELEKIKSDIFRNAVFAIYSAPKSFEIGRINDFLFDDFNTILNGLLPISKNDILSPVKRTSTYTETISNAKGEIIFQKNTPSQSENKQFQCLFEVGDISYIELEWTYKGRKLNTIALVSNKKGLIYDNILNTIHFPLDESKIGVFESVSTKTSLLKSGNENKPDGYYEYGFRAYDCQYSLLGFLNYMYDINVSMPFMISNGAYNLLYCTSSGTSNHGNGWHCNAAIQIISQQMGLNGHLHFAYAYGYGFGTTVSIGWNGTGFSISGGTSYQTFGTLYVNAAYLKTK